MHEYEFLDQINLNFSLFEDQQHPQTTTYEFIEEHASLSPLSSSESLQSSAPTHGKKHWNIHEVQRIIDDPKNPIGTYEWIYMQHRIHAYDLFVLGKYLRETSTSAELVIELNLMALLDKVGICYLQLFRYSLLTTC